SRIDTPRRASRMPPSRATAEPHPRAALKLVLQRVSRLVLAAVPETAALPIGELDLDRMLCVREKNLLEPPCERAVRDPCRNLVVDAERALVEVRRADRAPDAVDRHDLLMEQRLLVLEQADAALEQRAKVPVG